MGLIKWINILKIQNKLNQICFKNFRNGTGLQNQQPFGED